MMHHLLAWLSGIDLGDWMMWANIIGGIVLLGVVGFLVLLIRTIGGRR